MELERQETLKDQISTGIKNSFIDLTDKKTFDRELSFAIQL